MVEFVEALTIVLAVGSVRGWRSALIGCASGALFLTTLVLIFGHALQRVPIACLQVVVGVLLLLFGMRWLRKAILRAGGVLGMHDEAAIYEKQSAKLKQEPVGTGETLDNIALLTSFKAVTIEGLEVVFIVIATGSAGGALVPAVIGAALAGALVILLGIALHRPLTKVPENTLKFAVGVLLSAFGTFWFGEGQHFRWPGNDLALPYLVAVYLAAAVISAGIVKALKQRAVQP